MIDRRMVTDVGLALLIAFPSILPVAASPRSADSSITHPSENAREFVSQERQIAAAELRLARAERDA